MTGRNLAGETSAVRVIGVSAQGIRLLAGKKEYFLPFDDFPWFKDRPASAVSNVVELSPGHFYWPELDVDLSTEIIEHPERFPLVSRSTKVGEKTAD